MSPSKKAPPAAVVGVDIGSDSIKVAEAKYTKDGITISALGMAPVPPGVVENEVILDPTALGSAIKTLLSEHGIKTKQCVSAVAGQARVVVRVIEVPKMEKSELAETMKWEVERHVPFSPTQVVMDFQPLEKETPDPNAQNMEVLLAVAQDELISSHVEALLAAGLKPMAIDIEPLAASRSLIEITQNGVKEEIIAILNIGSRNTDLGVFEKGLLAFPSPPLGIAGTTLTQEIAEALSKTPEESEVVKKEYASVNLSGFGQPAPGIGMPAVSPEPTSMGMADNQIPDVGASFVQDTVSEVSEEAVDSADQSAKFHVTADGPVFDLGEPDASAEAAAPEQESDAVQPTGPMFDLGEAEPAQSEGPTFDLGSSEEDQQAPTKPVFDLDDEEPAAPPPPIQPAPVQTAFNAGSMEDRVFQAISGILVDLANEVRRSIEYYTTRYNKTPERIFVCGGTAKIPHLDEFLSQELGIKVEVADPLSNLKVNVASASDRYLREISPMFAVCVGLAIRDMVG